MHDITTTPQQVQVSCAPALLMEISMIIISQRPANSKLTIRVEFADDNHSRDQDKYQCAGFLNLPSQLTYENMTENIYGSVCMYIVLEKDYLCVLILKFRNQANKDWSPPPNCCHYLVEKVLQEKEYREQCPLRELSNRQEMQTKTGLFRVFKTTLHSNSSKACKK